MPKPRGGGGGHGGGGGGHDGAGGLRWLLTYADLITLLMVFFVVLYSISRTDEAKYRQLAAVLRETMLHGNKGNSVISTSKFPVGADKLMPNATASSMSREGQAELMSLQEVGRELAQALQEAGLSGQVNVTLSERGVIVSFADSVFFKRGLAEMKPEATQVLERIAPILKRFPNKILVEGHTDDLPNRLKQYPTSWELSVARAVAVTRHLTEREGLDPHRIGATGYGEWQPAYPNDSEENRARNRRVNLVLLGAVFSSADKPLQVITPSGPVPAGGAIQPPPEQLSPVHSSGKRH